MKLATDSHIKDDLGGPVSIKFNKGKTFDEYCTKHIADFDPDRFEVLALRVYYGKETAITLYAIDKYRQESSSVPNDQIPVKKFKLQANFLTDILSHIEECNFTVTTGNYPIENMVVINK